jgi:hypothetical protein
MEWHRKVNPVTTPLRLIIVLDIYLNRSAKTYCAGSVQEVEKSRIKLKWRNIHIWSFHLAEPECGFINARRQKIKIERYPVMERKQFRELIDKYSESKK